MIKTSSFKIFPNDAVILSTEATETYSIIWVTASDILSLDSDLDGG